MSPSYTRAEIENQLREKREHIDQRIGAIQSEVTGLIGTATNMVQEKPLASVGTALAAGIVVGLLVFGRNRSGRRGSKNRSAQRLVEDYVEALVDEVQGAGRAGKDAGESLRSALQDRFPVIVLGGATDDNKAKSMFREAMEVLVSSAVGFAGRALVERFQAYSEAEAWSADRNATVS